MNLVAMDAPMMRAYRLGFTRTRLDNEVLGNFDMYLFRKNPVWGLIDPDGTVRSVAVLAVGTRKKNAWGPYANWYAAHTLPAHRYQGRATRLNRMLLDDARAKGCVRVKSLIQSYAGVRLHWRLGHDFWGVTEKGYIQVDSPLDRSSAWPSTTPEQARSVTDRVQPLTPTELAAVLVAGGFATGPQELSFLDGKPGTGLLVHSL